MTEDKACFFLKCVFFCIMSRIRLDIQLCKLIKISSFGYRVCLESVFFNFQLLFINLGFKCVCIPKDSVTTSKEMPARKWT